MKESETGKAKQKKPLVVSPSTNILTMMYAVRASVTVLDFGRLFWFSQRTKSIRKGKAWLL